jgi:hypothetical protein
VVGRFWHSLKYDEYPLKGSVGRLNNGMVEEIERESEEEREENSRSLVGIGGNGSSRKAWKHARWNGMRYR